MGDLPILYCFKLDEESGIIVKHEIQSYKVKVHNFTHKKSYEFFYTFGQSRQKHIIPEERLNKYSSTKLYTFNPDFKAAYEIINDTILNKMVEAQAKVEKYSELFMKIKRNVVRLV